MARPATVAVLRPPLCAPDAEAETVAGVPAEATPLHRSPVAPRVDRAGAVVRAEEGAEALLAERLPALAGAAELEKTACPPWRVTPAVAPRRRAAMPAWPFVVAGTVRRAALPARWPTAALLRRAAGALLRRAAGVLAGAALAELAAPLVAAEALACAGARTVAEGEAGGAWGAGAGAAAVAGGV